MDHLNHRVRFDGPPLPNPPNLKPSAQEIEQIRRVGMLARKVARTLKSEIDRKNIQMRWSTPQILIDYQAALDIANECGARAHFAWASKQVYMYQNHLLQIQRSYPKLFRN